jgi:hypothetical protein
LSRLNSKRFIFYNFLSQVDHGNPEPRFCLELWPNWLHRLIVWLILGIYLATEENTAF